MRGVQVRRFAEPRIGKTLREIQVGLGLPSLEDLKDEFHGYMDVLLGRVEPPIDEGILTLMEVANAYHARACELDYLIHEAEREGGVIRGSSYYKFRTGELNSFIELTKRAAELGSRRLTQEQLMHQMRGDYGMLR